MMDRLIEYVEAEIQQLQEAIKTGFDTAVYCGKGKDIDSFVEIFEDEISELFVELEVKKRILHVLIKAAQKNLNYAN